MNKREELAFYGKLLHEKGLVIGTGGNISVRDKEDAVIKKREVDMSSSTPADYCSIPLEGQEADKDMASSETPLHLACYRADSSIGAVIHVHSPLSIAVASKIDRLDSVSYEFDCILKSSIPVIDYIQPGSESLAKVIAVEAKKGNTGVLLERHGAVSFGKDLKEAYIRILALERACIVWLNSR